MFRSTYMSARHPFDQQMELSEEEAADVAGALLTPEERAQVLATRPHQGPPSDNNQQHDSTRPRRSASALAAHWPLLQSATLSKLDQMYSGVYNEGASCWLDGRAAPSTTAGSMYEEVSSDSSSVSHLAQLGRFDDQAQPCSHKVHALRREVLEETVGKTIRP